MKAKMHKITQQITEHAKLQTRNKKEEIKIKTEKQKEQKTYLRVLVIEQTSYSECLQHRNPGANMSAGPDTTQ